MEAEVVQMCVNMFKGGKDACGTVMTSNLLFLSPLVTFCQRNYIIILYLLVYNACLCMKCTPILGCTLKKRIIIVSSSRKHRKCLRKTRIEKSYFVYTLKDVSIISSEMSLHAPAIHGTIRCSFGFFWLLIIVKSWVPSTIHCIQQH